jgi:putative membrane protein
MNRFRFSILPVLGLAMAAPLAAQEGLNDLEMAHVAVTANHSDIAYAHLALALSDNPAVRNFAETMIRDHSAVNEAVAVLAQKLDVQGQDNDFSRQLAMDAERVKDRLSGLRGEEFDRVYAENELRYHQTVNGIVENIFIPNIQHSEVKEAFKQALAVFRGHERHAEQMLDRVAQGK